MPFLEMVIIVVW